MWLKNNCWCHTLGPLDSKSDILRAFLSGICWCKQLAGLCFLQCPSLKECYKNEPRLTHCHCQYPRWEGCWVHLLFQVRLPRILWVFFFIILHIQSLNSPHFKMVFNSMVKGFFKGMDFWLECLFFKEIY